MSNSMTVLPPARVRTPASPAPRDRRASVPAPYDKPTYGSDVMVDAMRAMGFPYVALNPGSSF